MIIPYIFIIAIVVSGHSTLYSVEFPNESLCMAHLEQVDKVLDQDSVPYVNICKKKISVWS